MRRTRCTPRQRFFDGRTATSACARVAIRPVCHSQGQLFFDRDERELVDFARDERDVELGLERRDVVALRRDAADFDRELVDFRRDDVDLEVEVLRRRAVVDFDFERELDDFDFAFDRELDDFDFAFDRELVDFAFERELEDFAFERPDVDLRELVDFAFEREVVDLRELDDFDFADDFRFAVLDLDFEPDFDLDFEPDFDRDELPDFERAERDDEDFVSPACARCLLTVRAAISSARSVDSPFSFSDSLTCSY